ncbi:hypothetical protein BV25DRAFT_366087 [Artomyces pyxidatus]|uniref:Uncharacterized protein n=1 Tax=Artomyces pyxidatus TaxID=48021 RepID=A0ACB8T5Y7_9AGAM|nr:hypothetical protein BV25DRAFT_366087 [Artomyces pyxidatus]
MGALPEYDIKTPFCHTDIPRPHRSSARLAQHPWASGKLLTAVFFPCPHSQFPAILHRMTMGTSMSLLPLQVTFSIFLRTIDVEAYNDRVQRVSVSNTRRFGHVKTCTDVRRGLLERPNRSLGSLFRHPRTFTGRNSLLDELHCSERSDTS